MSKEQEIFDNAKRRTLKGCGFLFWGIAGGALLMVGLVVAVVVLAVRGC